MSSVARERFRETDGRFSIGRWSFPLLVIKTEMVADHQLIVNREVSQCGDIFTNVCALEPLGQIKGLK